MKSPLCTCAAVQRASPSFVWIGVQLWLYRYVYLESRYISSIFMIFVTKNFTKKLVHWYSMNKFFVKLSLFSVFVLHKTRTCFSVWVQYNSDWNLCQKLWLCLNILLGWMWEWKHWVNEQMVFDMLLNDLPVSVELFTVINASSHPWMIVEFVWVWHMLSLCIVLSSKCVEQW